MTGQAIANLARTYVGYIEKRSGTSNNDLNAKTNSYDCLTEEGGNWTRFHRDQLQHNIPGACKQGDDWCGIFAYEMFCELANWNMDIVYSTLYGLKSFAGVDGWYRAFPSSAIHDSSSAYVPQVGDLCIYSQTNHSFLYSHIGIVTDMSKYPQYGLITTTEGNTTYKISKVCNAVNDKSRTKNGVGGTIYRHWYLTPKYEELKPTPQPTESTVRRGIIPYWY